MTVRIVDVDPQGTVALSLLREATLDVAPLYTDRDPTQIPPPPNEPLPERGVYVVAYVDDQPLACGALRPLDESTAEVRRMYVHRDHRRQGLASVVLAHLITQATRLGFTSLLLETGDRQAPAIALYESFGFKRIAPFGPYVDDPTSICYELTLPATESR